MSGENNSTETISARFEALDVWPNADILDAMIGGQFAAIAAVRATLPDVSHAVDDAVPRLGRGGRLAYAGAGTRSEEHTSELQSLMRISYAVFCLKKKKQQPI